MKRKKASNLTYTDSTQRDILQFNILDLFLTKWDGIVRQGCKIKYPICKLKCQHGLKFVTVDGLFNCDVAHGCSNKIKSSNIYFSNWVWSFYWEKKKKVIGKGLLILSCNYKISFRIMCSPYEQNQKQKWDIKSTLTIHTALSWAPLIIHCLHIEWCVDITTFNILTSPRLLGQFKVWLWKVAFKWLSKLRHISQKRQENYYCQRR